jgi:selenide,water dikinase
MTIDTAGAIRLTSLAHGGGCGCKLSPAVLQSLLSGLPKAHPYSALLVGTETADDAAVWQIDDKTCVIATTDFFMPVVDDARDFGRIAATNAISDVYAMGGRPIFALAILGMPLDKLSPEVVRKILEGGAEVCAAANIPVAGGHSIDAPEPIYGLAVIGLCHPAQLRRNSMAKAGDALILTKAIGVGIYSAALKKGALSPEAYDEMIGSTTLLNRIGTDLADHAAVHAMTDVTGFGILGHALEMARGSGLELTIEAEKVPLLRNAAAWARDGYVTGASKRNWASYGADVSYDGQPQWIMDLLTDPQTSGGLLISCDSNHADALARRIRDAGYPQARIIGHARSAATPGVRVV